VIHKFIYIFMCPPSAAMLLLKGILRGQILRAAAGGEGKY